MSTTSTTNQINSQIDSQINSQMNRVDQTNRATLEHLNLTVSDAEATAAMLCRVFGWHIRWSGAAMGGTSVHVGTDGQYVALYTPDRTDPSKRRSYGGFNHLGVEVADLQHTRALVEAEGLRAYSFGSYEPGQRFYFNDENGIEYEVVTYS